jgi:hypothetical protein
MVIILFNLVNSRSSPQNVIVSLELSLFNRDNNSEFFNDIGSCILERMVLCEPMYIKFFISWILDIQL